MIEQTIPSKEPILTCECGEQTDPNRIVEGITVKIWLFKCQACNKEYQLQSMESEE